MPIAPGTYKLGPDNATLRVETGRHGAAAKAGHDLVMEVRSWDATLAVGDSSSLELNADTTSLVVLEGTGGMQALDDDNKADILKSIDKDILKQEPVTFRSSSVTQDDGNLRIDGDLAIRGKSQPISFDVSVGDDGSVRASTTVTQSKFGIKLFSALFGALKVNDDVKVSVDGKLPQG